ncbi:MAG: GYF domain-containing protein [Verrucomicrobia bacterium]|nr:GYF domain-containing protein [Verrucomicrobiota bacterium]
MSSTSRYYYVDAQNQAAGPIAHAELQNLRNLGTIQDSTLVVIEGGQDWVAFSSLGPIPSTAQPAPRFTPTAAASASNATTPLPSTAEPAWALELLQKVDQLNRTVEKMASALERSIASRPSTIAMPSTATLHAEKPPLNTAPKMGIAATLGTTVRPPNTLTGAPNSSTTLSPLAVPANAVKSPLPLPALNVKPATLPTPQPGAAPAKPGNLFSKFLKK